MLQITATLHLYIPSLLNNPFTNSCTAKLVLLEPFRVGVLKVRRR